MNRIGTWAKRGVWLTLAAVLTFGCSPLQTAAFLLHKDDKVPPQYPIRPAEGPKKEKEEEISILVLTTKGAGIPQQFAGLDRELASVLAKKLPEAAKENKDKLTVIPPAQLDKFKIANPTWRTLHPSQIGQKLGADYVLDITVSHVGLYQPQSAELIYEGRAEVDVGVYEVAAGAGEPRHRYTLQHLYPKTGMIGTTDLPLSQFKQRFLETLTLDVIHKHLEYKPADFIAADR
jgi:hypothetical protein